MIYSLDLDAPMIRPTHYRLLRGMVILCATWLAGCATNPDPHQGGFINGITGLANGNYQRRIDERESVYHTELSAGEQLRAQAQTLEQEREAIRGELNQAQSRLITLENRIKQARARLASQKQQVAAARAQQARLAQAQTQLVQTKRQLAAIRPQVQKAAPAQSIDALKQRSQALQHELNAIDDLVGSVADSGL
ncbi:hypothetical protein [Chromatium okenii]|uniref:hypothetical protein n=1 Tax=Chromatium okenii TaxID=61644 RepID=UPI0026EE2718|nr:hypothetical protein [Chromatium okenii]MBV5310989.1 hypothetical protein [Chromatium okenii]